MKKIISILLVIAMSFAMFGCGSNASSPQEEDKIKTFEEVYNGSELVPTLEYYSAYSSKMTEEEKTQYYMDIAKEASKQLEGIFSITNIEMREDFMGPPEIAAVNYMYPFYSIEDSMVDLDQLPYEVASAFEKIQNLDAFEVAKNFWVEAEFAGSTGFVVIVKPEVADAWLELMNYSHSNVDNVEAQWVSIPTMSYDKDKAMDDYTSEGVYVTEYEDLLSFSGSEAWKANLYYPVKSFGTIEDETVSNVSEVPEDEAPQDGTTNTVEEPVTDVGHEEVTDNTNKIKLSDLNDEEIRGTTYHFDDYHVIAVPQYEGAYVNTLNHREVIFGSDSDGARYGAGSVAVFGELESLTFTFIQGMDMDVIEQHIIKDVSNENVVIKSNLMSNDMTYFSITGVTANGKKVSCSIDDMRDPEAFPVVAIPKLTDETINGESIDFDAYKQVIVPMYDGINKDKLIEEKVIIGSVTQNNLEMDVNFAVFGNIEGMEVTFYEGMDDTNGYTVTYEGDATGNILVNVQIWAPAGDMSYIKVKGQTSESQPFEFTLDDMRDASEYDIITKQ